MQDAQGAPEAASQPHSPPQAAQQPASVPSTSAAVPPSTTTSAPLTAQSGPVDEQSGVTSSTSSAPEAAAPPTASSSQQQPADKSTVAAPLFLSQEASTADAPSPTAAADTIIDAGTDAEMDELDELDEDNAAAEVGRGDGKAAVPSAAASTSSAVPGPGPSSVASAAARESSTPTSAKKKKANGGIFPASGSGSSPTASSSTPAKRKKPRTSRGGAVRPYLPVPLPHFTVQRNGGTESDPHLLIVNDDVTDASKSRWPKQEEYVEGHKEPTTGRVSWYETPGRTVGKHAKFRVDVGQSVAEKLGLVQTTRGGQSEVWVLKDLPKNYIHTIHHSGPNGSRKDAYVFGSLSVDKFRTPNEFYPHLYWLLTHGPDDNLTCGCTWCTKRPQTQINRDNALTNGRASSVASQASVPGAARQRASPAPKATVKKEKGKGASMENLPRPPDTAEAASFFDKGGHRLMGDETAQAKDRRRRRLAEKEKEASGSKAKKARLSASDGQAESKPAYTGAFVNRARDGDLTDLFAHRTSDLVWAELPSPLLPSPELIQLAEDAVKAAAALEDVDAKTRAEAEELARCELDALKAARITHWPGVVKERKPVVSAKIKVKERSPTMVQPGESEVRAEGPLFEFEDEEAEEGGKNANGKGKGKETNGAGGKEKKKQQEWSYTVTLLAVNGDLVCLSGAQIRTWLAHPPPTTLWDGRMMTDPRAVRHVWDEEKRKTKRGAKLADFGGRLEEAAMAMALAMEIAGHVVGTYACADRMRISADYLDVDSAVANLTSTKSSVAKQTNSWSYQCLFWGAERIWPGDMVRLMFNDAAAFSSLPSAASSSSGAPADERYGNPAPVSIPGPTPKLVTQPSPASAGRSLFMRIFNIYKDAETNRVMVSGEVWELRDLKTDPPLSLGANGHGAGGVTNGAMSMFEKKAPPPRSSNSPPAASNGAKGPDGLYRLPDSASTAVQTVPPAPPAFEWRLLSSPSRHTACEVEHLGGRYHPLPPGSVLDGNRAAVDQVLESPGLSGPQQGTKEQQGEGRGGSGASLGWEERAVVLAGLRPAFRLFMKCAKASSSRHGQLVDAERKAANEVALYFADIEAEGMGASLTTGTPQPQAQKQQQ
ncbi:hypothetical protein JCM6882_003505 [Rhodosporidiobolus microsporus]